MIILKRQKTVKNTLLRPVGKLIKVDGERSGIVSIDNYYLSELVIIADQFFTDDDWVITGREILVNDYPIMITERMHDYYDIFEDTANTWRENFLTTPSFEERKNSLSESLTNVDWNCDEVPENLQINKKWCDLVHDMGVPQLYIGDELIEEDGPDHVTLSEWWNDLEGDRKRVDTFLHTPMILCEKDSSTGMSRPMLGDNSVQSKIIAAATLTVDDSDYITLSRKEQQEPVKSTVDKGDFSKPKLNPKDREKLAKRGVQAGIYYNSEKNKQEDKDMTLHKDFDTTRLEDYLSAKFIINTREDAHEEYVLNTEKGTRFTCNWFNELSQIEEFQALEFRDRVISEVIANSSRNVQKDTFIFRRISGYAAYVIIKPTQLGSVNDPKPIFYSIIFKGKTLSTIFEKVHTTQTDWKYTDFISSSRVRSSHEMNSMPQFMMMVFENLETLGSLGEEPEIDAVQNLSEPIKWSLLAHLYDKEEFSAMTSNFRYYYFSLFSGFESCKDEAAFLITKLPKLFRDPLIFLAVRRLIEIHNRLDNQELSQATSVLSQITMREVINEETDAEDAAYDVLPTVRTPFGFNITNSRSFLKAAYMSVYHNKDEAESGPAAKQIVAKMCKQEHHMTELLKTNTTPECITRDLGKKLPIYRFNLNACVLASDLLKEELISQKGLHRDSHQANAGFDEWIETTIIVPTLLESTYEILASTSASFVDNGEFRISTYKDRVSVQTEVQESEDNPIIGKTMKCLEAILTLRNKGVLMGMSPSDDLDSILVEFAETGSKLVIKIFKKNQLTGVREIYILTIIGRLMQRLAEDISRSIAKELHEEKLTSPETKDHFISEHKSAVSTVSGDKKSITINGSGDKTQWANYLQGKSITIPVLRVAPKKFHPLIAHFFNANTKKEIELPSSLISSFIHHPETDLKNEVLNEIKKAIISDEESSLAKHDFSRLRVLANTMQGIGHYTSSVFHLAALYLLRELLKRYIMRLGHDPYISFEVSSDDKGFMVTIIIADSERIRLVPLIMKITKEMRFYERIIDSAFGIRDSRFKSVTTISISFEFNSVFYFGNSIATPLQKFTTRCCDDSVQSTLHNRVCSLYSSVRQIRDNGGSGILCSLATMAQHIVMKCNLGFKNFSWFNADAMIDYEAFPYSHLGYRVICSPLTAGLCMSNYENDKLAHRFCQKNILEMLSRRDLDSEDLPDQLSMSTPLWRRDKHLAMLKRLGLEPHPLTSEEALTLLKYPRTPEELFNKIELMALSGSLARSFAYCQRSDLLRAGMYLMWHKGFTHKEKRICFRDLITVLRSMTNECYPLSETFYTLHDEEMSNRFYRPRSTRSKLMPRNYTALTCYVYVRNDLIRYLRELWFNEDSRLQEYVKREIKETCSWITDTPEEFFANREPNMLHRLINQSPSVKGKIKLLARGKNRGTTIVECLMLDNTNVDCMMTLTTRVNNPVMQSEARKYIKLATSRVSIWVDLLFFSYNNEQLVRASFIDLRTIANKYKTVYDIHCRRQQEYLVCYLMSHLKINKLLSTLSVFKLGSSPHLKLVVKEEPNSEYYYQTHLGNPVLVKKINNEVVAISCESNRVLDIISRYDKFTNASTNTMDIDYSFNVIGFENSNGTLCADGALFSIAGFLGVVYDEIPNDDKYIIPMEVLNHRDGHFIKRYIDRDVEFTSGQFDDLLESEADIPTAMRTALYWIGRDVVDQNFVRSTAVVRDAIAPVVAHEVTERRTMTDNMDVSSFLRYISNRAIEEDEDYSSSDDEGNRGSMNPYLEMYQNNEVELIAGVDHLETEKKERMDVPKCLRVISDMIKATTGCTRYRGNSVFFDLLNRMNAENR